MNRLILAVGVLVVSAGAATAQNAKISSDLSQLDPNTNVNVIVQFNQPPNVVQHAKVWALGGSLRAELHSIRGAAYSVSAWAAQQLASDPDVVFISPDRKVHMLLDNTTAAVNAPAAWSAGLDGSGIGVALIDSGISEHDDLQGSQGSRIVYRQSFVSGDTNDDFGHGEHVAGILGGNGTDSICATCTRNFIGVAPNVSLIDLQALDGNGNGSDSTVIAAIEQAIQLQSVYNIRVINLSLGRYVYESYTQDPLCQAVEAAWQAGIVVVAAAGNEGRINWKGINGYGTVTAPGNDPYVITVGAMKSMGTPQRTDDLIASYSSKGPTQIDHIVKPDLVAPGNLVVSLLSPTGILEGLYPQDAVPLSYYESNGDATPSSSYFTLSGTSMAAPVVSGAVALMLEANPGLTPDQVKARLMLTAYKTFPASSTAYDPTTGMSYTSYYDIFTVGAGYVDIQAALADNTPFFGTALSPTAVFYGQPSNATTAVTGEAYIACSFGTVCATSQGVGGGSAAGGSGTPAWGVQSIWGNQSVGQDLSISGNRSIWGTSSIWSSTSIFATRSIWGTSTTSDESLDIAISGEN